MKFILKAILTLILAVIVCLKSSFAADHVTLSLQNPTSTFNTLEFDVYIVNDGTTALNLGGYQFGINFASSILAGGTPAAGSYTYLAGTRDASFALLNNPSVQYNNSQLRVVANTVLFPNATPMPIGVQRSLGRFRFTNTVNWLANSQPNLQLQLLSATGKTHAIAACFIGAATVSTSLTNVLSTLNGTINFSGIILNSTLPVHVTSFNGHKEGNEDRLTWSTSQEENNDHFDLQHSTDGLYFTTIQQIKSASEKGNSVNELHYTAMNVTPLIGHNYYRLEQVDIDGRRTIETDIVDLLRSSNEQTVMVFPNPVKDLLTIQFQTKQCAETAINLLDLNGHIVQRNSSTSSPGMNQCTIDTNGLADGIYVIQLCTNKVILFSETIRKTH